MGIYRVQSPYAANVRAIRSAEERERQLENIKGRAESRAYDERLRQSHLEASKAASVSQRQREIDDALRQIKEQLRSKGTPQWNKFIWHGELPKGTRIKAPEGPAPFWTEDQGTSVKTKLADTERTYNILLKAEPTDENKNIYDYDVPGLPDITKPEIRGRQYIRKQIPPAPGPFWQEPGAGPQQQATAMMQALMPQTPAPPTGGTPGVKALPGGGFDLTQLAQTGYTAPPAETQVPLQHLFQQVGALQGQQKTAGKSKMDDYLAAQQALSQSGMAPLTREETVSGFGFGPKTQGQGVTVPRPPGGVKGQTKPVAAGVAAPPAAGPAAPQGRPLSSLKEVTADPVAYARLKYVLSQYGITPDQLKQDKIGVYWENPQTKERRYLRKKPIGR